MDELAKARDLAVQAGTGRCRRPVRRPVSMPM
jgi:hypothetical protein